jgi:hypothetical protein
MTGVAEPLIQASLLGEAIEHGPVAVFVAESTTVAGMPVFVSVGAAT